MDISTFQLSQLPPNEDPLFEFKSSRTIPGELEKKLVRAVSAFANSGGGTFVAGIEDATGNADGGIEKVVGRQRLLDWADRVIHNVKPTPVYHTKLIEDPDGRGTIDPGKAVLVVSVEESLNGPHMAPDGHYYIRAGRHTDPAGHFIVDAIWAKRHFSKPRLVHLLRETPDDRELIQIGLVALTDAPAIDIVLAMEPLPGLYHQGSGEFPVHIGVIDRNTPFFFDVSTREEIRRHPDDEFVLKVTYHDLASNTYQYEQPIRLYRSIPSLRFFRKSIDDIVVSLDSIKIELAKRASV